MFDIADALLKNSDKIIEFVALAIALFFGHKLFKQFESKVDQAETNTANWSDEVQAELRGTKLAVATHSEDLGKATKAIAGDFLKMKEQLIDLRSDISKSADQLRHDLTKTMSELALIDQKTKFISDHVTEKTGKVIIVEQKMIALEDTMTKLVRATNANTKNINTLKGKE